ncbi:MAG: FHA domain-containing protein [Candidatus Lernaella stagnicola]|nr:FHA domain-containing protein [Candidatus Lernaella stagnicola]
MYRLEMTDDLGRILSYPLKEQGAVSVGRQESNDIVLLDKSVSRQHCIFHVDGDSVAIEDSASVNGVLVGGQRISTRTPLHRGDEIIIGEYRFFLRVGGNVDDDTKQTFVGNLP